MTSLLVGWISESVPRKRTGSEVHHAEVFSHQFLTRPHLPHPAPCLLPVYSTSLGLSLAPPACSAPQENPRCVTCQPIGSFNTTRGIGDASRCCAVFYDKRPMCHLDKKNVGAGRISVAVVRLSTSGRRGEQATKQEAQLEKNEE